MLPFGGALGLREKKAHAKRNRIVEEALALFAAQGFEETTMESIAEAAEISPSTLYRSFQGKDLIVLAGFSSEAASLADVFEATSDDVPVGKALAHAILVALEKADQQPERTLLMRSILDQTPIARARLWDMLAVERSRLGRVLAKRLKMKETDPRIILTARLAFLIAETASDLWRAQATKQSAVHYAKSLMTALSQNMILMPITSAERPKTRINDRQKRIQ
jgi:AcrR family transcriptional regulator